VRAPFIRGCQAQKLLKLLPRLYWNTRPFEVVARDPLSLQHLKKRGEHAKLWGGPFSTSAFMLSTPPWKMHSAIGIGASGRP